MSFAHHPEHINRKGRPKGSSKSNLLRSAIQERIDIDQLFDDINDLPLAAAIKYKIELVQYVLPRLKAVETSANNLSDHLEALTKQETINLIDKLIEQLERD
jgi:SUMO ligase MMS21 Smc5/6 complex component